MQARKNKALVTAYFDAVNRGDLAAAFLLVSDVAVCTIPASLPLANVQTKLHFLEVKKAFRRAFAGGLQCTVRELTSDGNRVAAEVESSGVHSSGRLNQDTHCVVFTVSDGMIQSVNEYFDTLALLKCWSAPSGVSDGLSWS